MRQSFALTCALALAAATGLAGCGFQEEFGERDRSVETRPLDPDGTFTLDNTNGEVVVTTWQQARVQIEAQKAGSRWALERMKVEIRGEGDRVSVETRSPRRWFFGGGRVDYRITVPERAQLRVRTTNGRVRIQGAAGPVRASATNGSVEVDDAAGTVEARTTNGAVRVAFRAARAHGSNRFSTTNGSVTLTLPGDATGEFEASTVNGGIQTDFPLEVSGRFGGRRLSGRIGEGQARYELRTVNGGVRIRKS